MSKTKPHRNATKGQVAKEAYKKAIAASIPNSAWEDWDEDLTVSKPVLALNAATYKSQAILNVPAGGRADWHYLVSPQGNFAYRNKILDGYTPLSHFDDEGVTLFNGDVALPMLIDMNRRTGGGRRFKKKTSEYKRSVEGAIWMSPTPAEMLTQRSGVQMAKGKVLIGGLGLGWFLNKVCEKPTVDEVVIVERSQELLDWYGYDLCKKQVKVKDVICNDVYSVADNFPNHQLLLDIWPVFRGHESAETDARLAALRTVSGDRVWAWGMD
jgi:hypothetical protein